MKQSKTTSVRVRQELVAFIVTCAVLPTTSFHGNQVERVPCQLILMLHVSVSICQHEFRFGRKEGREKERERREGERREGGRGGGREGGGGGEREREREGEGEREREEGREGGRGREREGGGGGIEHSISALSPTPPPL